MSRKIICKDIRDAQTRYEKDKSNEYYYPYISSTADTLVKYKPQPPEYEMIGTVELTVINKNMKAEALEKLKSILENSVTTPAIYDGSLFGGLHVYNKELKHWRIY